MNKLRIYLPYFLLVILFVTGFTLRMYKFDNPIADWHSWRQADTASVTRNFVKEGFTPLYPKFDALNSLNENNVPNPKRYFFAEFPVYNSITYWGFITFGYFTLEQWGRLVSIFFSSITIVWLFLLVRQYSSLRIALISAGIFAYLPFNIYYGRVIMPDPLHVSFSVLALYLVAKWTSNSKWWWGVLGGIAFAIAVLAKPYGLVLLLPIFYLILRKWRLKIVKSISMYLFVFIALVPLYLWRQHIGNYPEGQFGTAWLFNQGDIRFTGAYFRWLIFDRMNRLIFATGGFVLFWLGIISGNDRKEGFFYYVWFVAILIFFVVIAKGNVTHDYYQMPLVPIGAIFMAKGIDFLLVYGHKWYHRVINVSLALSLCMMMLAFGWYEVRDYFNINRMEIVTAGQYVDQNLPKNAKVIAPYDFDPAFLYQTNRHGWTYGRDKIIQWMDEGADYMVSVNFDDDTNYWMERCKVVKKVPQFVVLDMKQCNVSKPNEVAFRTGL